MNSYWMYASICSCTALSTLRLRHASHTNAFTSTLRGGLPTGQYLDINSRRQTSCSGWWCDTLHRASHLKRAARWYMLGRKKLPETKENDSENDCTRRFTTLLFFDSATPLASSYTAQLMIWKLGFCWHLLIIEGYFAHWTGTSLSVSVCEIWRSPLIFLAKMRFENSGAWGMTSR